MMLNGTSLSIEGSITPEGLMAYLTVLCVLAVAVIAVGGRRASPYPAITQIPPRTLLKVRGGILLGVCSDVRLRILGSVRLSACVFHPTLDTARYSAHAAI